MIINNIDNNYDFEKKIHNISKDVMKELVKHKDEDIFILFNVTCTILINTLFAFKKEIREQAMLKALETIEQSFRYLEDKADNNYKNLNDLLESYYDYKE